MVGYDLGVFGQARWIKFDIYGTISNLIWIKSYDPSHVVSNLAAFHLYPRFVCMQSTLAHVIFTLVRSSVQPRSAHSKLCHEERCAPSSCLLLAAGAACARVAGIDVVAGIIAALVYYSRPSDQDLRKYSGHNGTLAGDVSK